MKIAAVLMAAVILSGFCSVPVVAAGNELPEEKTIGVFAKAVYTLPDGCYGAEEEDDGGYIAELPDGTRITWTSESRDPSLRVVIAPITEQDAQAYRWIAGCAAGIGTDPLFYDIYFVNEYGARVDVNRTFEVSIALAKGRSVSQAAEIFADGGVSPLVSKSDGNRISFTIEKGGYYAVASEKSGNAGTPVAPETGDNGMLGRWIALLFVSGAGIAGATVISKRKGSVK